MKPILRKEAVDSRPLRPFLRLHHHLRWLHVQGQGQTKKRSQGKTFLPSLWQADVRLVVAALRGKTVLRQRAALSTGP